MNYSQEVKEKLFSLISEMAKSHWLFVNSPEKDFSRCKKWSFEDVIKFVLSMENRSLKDELLHYFEFDTGTPTNSSFNQRREQILPEAFEFLFNEFNHSFSGQKTWHGLKMIACDGSDINIHRDPSDADNYLTNGSDSQGYNQLHLNAFYDLCERKYVDAVIQPGVKNNECHAMVTMIDRYAGNLPSVVIADRGFESYNVFAHAQEKGLYYLVRARDAQNSSIISGLKKYHIPDSDEYDILVPLKLTRKQTKKEKEHPEIFKYVSHTSPMDYLDLKDNLYYDITLRIVRIRLSEETYECLITNLPQEEYPVGLLKEMYAKRWGIETSFRELKYSIGMTAFHSKKVKYIKQEIWARLILYNFCEVITTSVVVKQKKNWKYLYQLNYSRAIGICHYFIRIKKEKAPPDIELLISRELLPIRTGRSDPRKVKPKSAISFLYRAA